MSALKVGIVGVGNMGSAHATTLSENKVEGFVLSALCDIDPKRAEILKDRFHVPVYLQYEEMLEKEPLDVIIIAVPHFLHCAYAEKALDLGKHVLTEKPMDVRLSAGLRLAEKARKSDKVFAIMFNQRTNPLFVRTREIIASGELGKIKKSTWTITNWYRTQAYYDSGAWRATWGGEGGGVLMNQAPHQLDLWQWILGMPSAVTAFGSIAKYHKIEVEDDATIVTEYPNGAIGIFTTSTGEFPGTNRLEISGTLGKLVLEEGVLKLWKLKEDEESFRFRSREGFAAIPYDYSEVRQEEPENGHLNILRNFSDAIRNGTPLISPGMDGLNELTLSNAAYLSMWTGKKITLPLDTETYEKELKKRMENSRVQLLSPENDRIADTYSERWQVRW